MNPPRAGFPARVQAKVVNCLRQAAGGIVSKPEMIDYVYADDPEGGPFEPMCTLNLAIFTLRKRGFPIECVGRRGYRYRWTEWEVA